MNNSQQPSGLEKRENNIDIDNCVLITQHVKMYKYTHITADFNQSADFNNRILKDIGMTEKLWHKLYISNNYM